MKKTVNFAEQASGRTCRLIAQPTICPHLPRASNDSNPGNRVGLNTVIRGEFDDDHQLERVYLGLLVRSTSSGIVKLLRANRPNRRICQRSLAAFAIALMAAFSYDPAARAVVRYLFPGNS